MDSNIVEMTNIDIALYSNLQLQLTDINKNNDLRKYLNENTLIFSCVDPYSRITSNNYDINSIYAYSYTIFIPVIILCSSGYVVTQWIFLAYGFFHSTSFIIVNYWRELGKYVDKLRIIIILLIIGCQGVLVFTFKLYFFQKFEDEINNNNMHNALNQTIGYKE